MPAGHAIIRATLGGARGGVAGSSVGGRLTSSERQLQRILLTDLSQFMPPALRQLRAFAPHKSGRMERGLHGRVSSYGGRVTIEFSSTARSDTGFDYLDVTRYGHRQAFLTAKHGKVMRFFPSAPDVAGTGKPLYRKFVRGYKPRSDWVADAAEAIEQDMARLEERVGESIERLVLE